MRAALVSPEHKGPTSPDLDESPNLLKASVYSFMNGDNPNYLGFHVRMKCILIFTHIVCTGISQKT